MQFDPQKLSVKNIEYLQGNEGCAIGALYAGCRFYAGYPITPSSEIMHFMAKELPTFNGVFIQMEDELSSIAAVIGASWAGKKSMTATSGPGFSLMQENIGYAIMTETPCVIVNIQRAGPSTGQATRPASGDIYQTRFGSHGDYEIIVLSPASVYEMFEFTIKAFNLSEQYRVPVILAAEECIGHLREKVKLNFSLPVVERKIHNTGLPPFGYEDNPEKTTPMPCFGTGQKLLVTGSTHDIYGYRKTQSPEIQHQLVNRLCKKIRNNVHKIFDYEGTYLNDMEYLLISYGFTSRTCMYVVEELRKQGKKFGLLRLKTVWPIDENKVKQICKNIKRIYVPEMNKGHVIKEIERITKIEVKGITRTDGEVIEPMDIINQIN